MRPFERHRFWAYLFAVIVLLGASTESLAQMQFEGVKFHVHNTQQPRTVRLYRLLLSDQSHLYTISEAEVKTLTSKRHGASIELMEAWVYKAPTPSTVRLYRFAQKLPNNVSRHFYTAFEPNMRDVLKQPNSRLHPMKCFVYPHTYVPKPDEGIIPVFSFYNPESGEHFYSTSEEDKRYLIKLAEDEKRRKLEAIADRFRKFRKQEATAVALRENPLSVGDIEWRIVDVKSLGNTIKSDNQFIEELKTPGRFVWLEIRVENKGKSLKTIVSPPLFDDQGRAFESSSEAHFHIPKDKNFLILKNLNPNVPLNAVFIYEIPADATSLTLLAGDLDLIGSSEGAIDLGL
jgi:hypothetical protein